MVSVLVLANFIATSFIFESHDRNGISILMINFVNFSSLSRYRWLRNGGHFYEELPYTSRVDPTKGTLLAYRELTAFEGFFQCVAENSFGSARSDVARLWRAYIEPHYTQKMKTYEGFEGEGLIVSCDETESLPLPTFSWVIVRDVEDENPIPVTLNHRVQTDLKGQFSRLRHPCRMSRIHIAMNHVQVIILLG